jgi:hypothetical protein
VALVTGAWIVILHNPSPSRPTSRVPFQPASRRQAGLRVAGRTAAEWQGAVRRRRRNPPSKAPLPGRDRRTAQTLETKVLELLKAAQAELIER